MYYILPRSKGRMSIQSFGSLLNPDSHGFQLNPFYNSLSLMEVISFHVGVLGRLEDHQICHFLFGHQYFTNGPSVMLNCRLLLYV